MVNKDPVMLVAGIQVTSTMYNYGTVACDKTVSKPVCIVVYSVIPLIKGLLVYGSYLQLV